MVNGRPPTLFRPLTAYQPFKALENVISRFAFQAYTIIADDQDSNRAAIEDNRSHALCLVQVLNAGNRELHWQAVGNQIVACFVSWICLYHAGKRDSARNKPLNDFAYDVRLIAWKQRIKT